MQTFIVAQSVSVHKSSAFIFIGRVIACKIFSRMIMHDYLVIYFNSYVSESLVGNHAERVSENYAKRILIKL